MSSEPSHGTRSYLINIAWSWLSVVALLVSAIFVTRILILRLGKPTFGIWALAVSLVEYFWMIDLGFRPATVKLSAEFRALDRLEDINRLINTALAYAVTAGVVVLAAAWFNAGRIAALFNIDDPNFPFLIRTVGLSWAAGLVFNIFAATLEGFQRFDLSNRTSIVASLLRSGISVVVVLQGYGLREMGWVLLISQSIGYLMMYFYCRQIYPELRFSTSLVSWPMASRILSYSRQILPGILGSRFAQGALPSVIAFFRPPQFVTFYTQTQRMMDYAADAISRVGLVTAPRVSHWEARGQRQDIIELTRVANRYCLTLWGLWASFLFVYGRALCRVWIDQEFADNVAPLLPFFLAAYTLFMGQFISAAVLMGIARYQSYSMTLLIEAVASVGAMALLLPRFGLAGGVAGVTTMLGVSRWFVLSRIFSREFGISQARYLWDIFHRPTILITGSVLALYACRGFVASGTNLYQLAAIGLIFAPVYIAAVFVFVLDKEHQAWVLTRVRTRWDRLLGTSAP